MIKVKFGEEIYNGYINAKSVSIENNGLRRYIKKTEVVIDRSTYWKYGRWDAMFETTDITCNLCRVSSGASMGCNCPETGFSLQEHEKNLLNINN